MRRWRAYAGLWPHWQDIRLASAPISQAQADQWLAEDLQRFADGIHRLLPGSICGAPTSKRR
jgi:hypothetical protein